MDSDWIADNWKQLISLMQEKWGKLTYNDLVAAAGERENLVGLLQEHYSYQRARAETELDEFTQTQKANAAKGEQCSFSPKP